MRIMKTLNRIVRSVVAIVLIGGLPSAQADDQGASILGIWALEVSGPRGVQHPTLKVERDEDTYHGVFTGQRGEVLIKEIQVEGNAFSFPLKVPTPMGKIKLHYSGQIDAGLIQGKIKTPRGAMPFTGKRME